MSETDWLKLIWVSILGVQVLLFLIYLDGAGVHP